MTTTPRGRPRELDDDDQDDDDDNQDKLRHFKGKS